MAQRPALIQCNTHPLMIIHGVRAVSLAPPYRPVHIVNAMVMMCRQRCAEESIIGSEESAQTVLKSL